MKERNLRILLIFLLLISVLINISYYMEDKHAVSQKRWHSEQDLEFIALVGNNLANHLENFLNYSIEAVTDQDIESNEERHLLQTDMWRVAHGESNNISYYLARLSPHLMKDLRPKWSLLIHSLHRVNGILSGLNTDFLAQRSYDISDEKAEQLDAIIMVYRKLYETVESGAPYPVLVIDELTEQMMIIDQNYAEIVERVEPK